MNGDVCTADTLFDCASTSKSFTAACVALLVEDKEYADVQWRTPLCKILPDDFVLSDPYLTANVTIEDILSHRTGDPGHDNSLHGQKATKPDTAKSVTQNLRNLPFNKPLRTDYQYSNVMYTVATNLIETVTGESYAEFVRKKIWEPLSMLNTYHDVTNVEERNARARLAMGYHWDKKRGKYIATPSYAQPEAQGAGCVFSSVTDYAKWVRALLQQSGPLSEGAHKEMTKGRSIISFDRNDALPLYGHSLYALGLIVESYRGHVVIGHDGTFYGFRALMRYLPGQDWGIVIFGNSNNAFYVLQILFHTLLDEVTRTPQEERTDWPEYWRRYQMDEEKEEERGNSELLPPDLPVSLPVHLTTLVGEYTNIGYRTLVLVYNEGRLEANCSDRCTPFKLVFTHFSGNQFIVKYEDLISMSTSTLKAEFDIDENGLTKGLGIPLCENMENDPIWFRKLYLPSRP